MARSWPTPSEEPSTGPWSEVVGNTTTLDATATTLDTTGAARSWTLLDNDVSAMRFGSTGTLNLLVLNTTNNSETVTVNGLYTQSKQGTSGATQDFLSVTNTRVGALGVGTGLAFNLYSSASATRKAGHLTVEWASATDGLEESFVSLKHFHQGSAYPGLEARRGGTLVYGPALDILTTTAVSVTPGPGIGELLCTPPAGHTAVTAPSPATYPGRVLWVRHVGTQYLVNITRGGYTFNGSATLTLLPGESVRLTNPESGTDIVAHIISAPGAAKAWVRFNGTGAVAIVDSFNVSSITDNGTGDYTINYTNARADGNYCALTWANVATTLPYTALVQVAAAAAGGSHQVKVYTPGGAVEDANPVHFALLDN